MESVQTSISAQKGLKFGYCCMTKDYSELSKEEFIKIVQKLESRKKYGFFGMSTSELMK